MTDINQVKNAILRKSFSSFVQKCFYELNPSEAFIKGAYIDLLCDQIQNMIEGKNQKLIINLPPRYLKSVICSIALPAFILGHNPSTKIMCISYGEELASKLAADCKSVMEADWYKALSLRRKSGQIKNLLWILKRQNTADGLRRQFQEQSQDAAQTGLL